MFSDSQAALKLCFGPRCRLSRFFCSTRSTRSANWKSRVFISNFGGSLPILTSTETRSPTREQSKLRCQSHSPHKMTVSSSSQQRSDARSTPKPKPNGKRHGIELGLPDALIASSRPKPRRSWITGLVCGRQPAQ